MSRWADPSWRAGALAWVGDRLAEQGLVVAGEITQPHVYPWATALRIPTDGGAVWFKAAAPGPAYEVGLLAVLARVDPAAVLPAIALDPARGWSLHPDGGQTLRAALEGRAGQRVREWERVLPRYAALQRLAAAAVPDLRPLPRLIMEKLSVWQAPYPQLPHDQRWGRPIRRPRCSCVGERSGGGVGPARRLPPAGLVHDRRGPGPGRRQGGSHGGRRQQRSRGDPRPRRRWCRRDAGRA